MSRTWKREPIRRNRHDYLELSEYNKASERKRKREKAYTDEQMSVDIRLVRQANA